MSVSEMPGNSRDLVAESLSRLAVALSYEDIPAEVAIEAKKCLQDTTGVALAGSQHPTALLAQGQVNSQYGPGRCTIFGKLEKASAAGAAFANGVAAHVLDYDDVSYEGMVHGTAVVWPAVLAAAEAGAATGEQVLTAFVAGVEAEYALGRAFTHDLFWRGWWTTGLLGALGAAIGASKAMDADARTTREAVCIAACQTSGPYVLVGSPIKAIASGRAAELGVQAALLAANGLTAPADTFEHEHGLITKFGDGTFQPHELDRLGDRYVLSASRVAFKRYPVCAGAQSAIEGLLDLMDEENLAPEQVVGIRCEVTPDVGHYMPYARPQSVTEAQFSMPFCLACALTFGDVGVAHLDDTLLRDPQMLNRMDVVEVVLSEELMRREAEHDDVHQPARIRVQMDDGRDFTRFNPAPTGMPVKPISDASLDSKFDECAKYALSRPASLKLRNRLRSIETLPAAADLFADL